MQFAGINEKIRYFREKIQVICGERKSQPCIDQGYASVGSSIDHLTHWLVLLTGCAKKSVLGLLLKNHTCYRSYELKFESEYLSWS